MRQFIFYQWAILKFVFFWTNLKLTFLRKEDKSPLAIVYESSEDFDHRNIGKTNGCDEYYKEIGHHLNDQECGKREKEDILITHYYDPELFHRMRVRPVGVLSLLFLSRPWFTDR